MFRSNRFFESLLVASTFLICHDLLWPGVKQAIYVDANGDPLDRPQRIDCPECGSISYYTPGMKYQCLKCQHICDYKSSLAYGANHAGR